MNRSQPQQTRLVDIMPECANHLSKLLSEVGDPELLIAVVNCLVAIALPYPSAFQAHFEEAIDYLIGWHLEPTTSSKIVTFTTKVLLSFEYFWITNPEHTAKIMGEFIDDIEAYKTDLEKLEHGTESINSFSSSGDFLGGKSDKVFEKIIALIKVFGIIAKSLKKQCMHRTFKQVIYKSIKRVANCAISLSTSQQNNFNGSVVSLIEATNSLLVDLNIAIPSLIVGETSTEQASGLNENLCESVFVYVMKILNSQMGSSESVICSCLKMLQGLIENSTGQIPLHVIESLFVENESFRSLRFCGVEKVMTACMLVYQEVLLIKDVPTLETIYKIMLSEVQLACQNLLEQTYVSSEYRTDEEKTENSNKGVAETSISGTNSSQQVGAPMFYLVTDPYQISPNFISKNASEVIIFNFSALSPLSAQKTSLIANYALKPSLFDLLCKKLRLVTVEYAHMFPQVQYSTLYLLYTHVAASHHFTATATWNSLTGKKSTANSSPDENTFSFSQSTKYHYLATVDLLNSCLATKKLSDQTIVLCLTWFNEGLNILKNETSSVTSERLNRIISTNQIQAFIFSFLGTLTLTNSQSVHDIAFELIVNILSLKNPPPKIVPSIAQLCVTMLTSNDDEIVQIYSSLLNQLPIGAFPRLGSLDTARIGLGSFSVSPVFQESRRCIMRSEPNSQLLPYDFKLILNGVFTEINDEKQYVNGNILESFFYKKSSVALKDGFANELLSHTITFEEVSWFYALWEIANACIVGKLKTALGKANETFSGFESVLRKHCATIRGLQVQTPDSEMEKEPFSCFNNMDSLMKPKRMLLFLDCLEKQLYNASEGVVCSLPVSNKAARTFFRTNRDVCKTWFKQIRVHAACLAQAVNEPTSVVYHVQSYFSELHPNEKLHSEHVVELCLMLYSALIDLGTSDPLHGFNVYYSKKFGSQFPFDKLFHLHCRGNFEEVSKLYEIKLLGLYGGKESDPKTGEDSKSKVHEGCSNSDDIKERNPNIVRFMLKNFTLINKSLRQFEKLEQFCENFAESSKRYVPGNFIDDLSKDLSYIKKLQSFDQLDFLQNGKCENLENLSQNSGNYFKNVEKPVWSNNNLLKSVNQSLIDELQKVFDLSNLTHSEEDGNEAKKSPVLPSLNFCEDLEVVLTWLVSSNGKSKNTALNEVLSFIQMAKFLMTPKFNISSDFVASASSSLMFPNESSKSDLCQLRAWENGLKLMELQKHVAELKKDSHAGKSFDYFCDNLFAKKMEYVKVLRKSLCFRRAAQVLLSCETSEFDYSTGCNDLVQKLTQVSSELAGQTVANQSGTTEMSQLTIKESAKILFNMNCDIPALNSMSEIVNLNFTQNEATITGTKSLSNMPTQSSLGSRAALSLAKWLSLDSKYAEVVASVVAEGKTESTANESLRNVINRALSVETNRAHAINDTMRFGKISRYDRVIGGLYDLSLCLDENNAKAWFRLACWSFKFAKKVVNEVSSDTNMLTPEEIRDMKLLLEKTSLSLDTVVKVESILTKPLFNGLQEEDITANSAEPNLWSDGGAVVRKLILSVAPEVKDEGVLEPLMCLWQKACDRVFSLFALSASSYFKYLSLECNPFDDSNVTATLRLLRILVSHAWELQDTLERGLKTTPTGPWQCIIPQLFSRLNHPEHYVRKSVADLLNRIATETPHLIVYPVIVGCEQKISEGKMRSKRRGNDSILTDKINQSQEDEQDSVLLHDDENSQNEAEKSGMKIVSLSSQTTSLAENVTEGSGDNELGVSEGLATDVISQSESALVAEDAEGGANEDNEEYDDDDMDVNELYSSRAEIEHCYSMLLETVTQCDSQLVADVNIFVNELRRVSVLWDELWLSALTHYSGEVNRYLSMVEYERRRLDRNKSLTLNDKNIILAAKYSAYMKPVIFVFEQLLELTSRTPETAHEEWFLTYYTERFRVALEKLKNPENVRKPAPSWHMFNELYQELLARNSKKGAFSLGLKSIAPKLANLKNACIPLILSERTDLVTIQSFRNTITIMPTKTKPKKITVVGNNGEDYSYLFKGLEDLHLDERIMQFLVIVNTMFEKNNKQDSTRLFRARNYAVTPLGPRSGLIQWVDGAVPLFGLYKKWQQREAYAALLKKQQQSLNQQSMASQAGTSHMEVNPVVPQVPIVPRPSELYHEKIVAALNAMGLPETTSRKEWPLKLTRQVLDELVKETPNYLLFREMWCSATNCHEWWSMNQQYNSCCALMSVVGYIIGLGDRHLDNMLIDLSTGELVHIDYNVCFEKGKNLRVPEKVPFRLTQNLLHALGVTGYEGTFRQSAEVVLRLLKRGRETLLTLLEAFVYDPLVDWMHSSDLGFIGALQFKKNNEALKSEKKEVDFAISYSLLCAKMVEIKTNWLKNKDDVVRVLKRLPESLQNMRGCLFSFLEAETMKTSLENGLEYLAAAEKSQSHSFWTLQSRMANAAFYQCIEDEFDAKVASQLDVCTKWVQKAQVISLENRNQFLINVVTELSENEVIPPCGYNESETYLRSVSQVALLEDCQVTDSQLLTAFTSQNAACLQLSQVLVEYLTIIHRFGGPSPSLVDDILSYCQKLKSTDFKIEQSFNCEDLLKIIEPPKKSAGKSARIEAMLMTELKSENDIILKYSNKLGAAEEAKLVNSQALLEQRLASLLSEIPADDGLGILTVIILNYMATFGNQYVHMEMAAFSAHDEVLKNSKSIEGDWFLDEIESLGNTLKTLSMFLKLRFAPQLSAAVSWPPMSLSMQIDSVIAAFTSYTLLVEFYQEMAGLIMPDCLTKLSTVNQVSSEVIKTQSQLTKALGHCENLLQDLSETLISDEAYLLTLSKQMDDLVIDLTNIEVVNQFLPPIFQCFNQLGSHFESLLTSVNNSQGPEGLSDIIAYVTALKVSQEVSHIQSRGRPSTENYLKLWLKFSSVKAIVSFLSNILKFELTLRIGEKIPDFNADQNSLPNGNEDSNENLVCMMDCLDPIKLFVASFVRKQVIGLPSRCLAHLILQCAATLGVDLITEMPQYIIDESEDSIKLEAVHKIVQKHVTRSRNVNDETFHKFVNVFSDFEGLSRERERLLNSENQLAVHQRLFQLMRQNLTKFQWTKYHLLVVSGTPPSDLLATSRWTVLETIKSNLSEVTIANSKTEGLFNELKAKEDKIEARLKWAAGLYKESLNSFTILRKTRDKFLMRRIELVQDVIGVTNFLLQYEELQTWSEAHTRSFIDGCLEIISLMEKLKAYMGRKVDISSTEKLLVSKVQTTSFASEVESKTLREKAYEVLTSEEKQQKAIVDSKWAQLTKSRDELKLNLQPLKAALAAHNNLMRDLKILMRPLNREQEIDYGAKVGNSNISQMIFSLVRKYVLKHNNFTDTISSFYSTVNPFVANVSVLKSDSGQVERVEKVLKTLVEIAPQIYSDMVDLTSASLMNNLSASAEGASHNPGSCQFDLGRNSMISSFGDGTDQSLISQMFSGKLIMRQDDVTSQATKNPGNAATRLLNTGPTRGATFVNSSSGAIRSSASNSASVNQISSSGAMIRRDPRTGKALQERNSFAISVWRKVKYKLDGIDSENSSAPGSSSSGAGSSAVMIAQKKMTVNEHVDFIINEAVNPSNLCQMYEGWTAWV